MITQKKNKMKKKTIDRCNQLKLRVRKALKGMYKTDYVKRKKDDKRE